MTCRSGRQHSNCLKHTPCRKRPIRATASMSLLVLVTLLFFPLYSHGGYVGKSHHPIVLVPGYGSNQVEARVTEAYRPSVPRCGARKGKGWFQLWPNHTALHESREVPCFVEQMGLVYDAVADDYRNVAGVVTRVPYFGSTRGLINWDPLVRRLEAMGYRVGENLFAAPYDFRYGVAPPGHPSKVGSRYFHSLKHLIRRASKRNDGKPAIMVAHSYGCALTYHFLLDRPLPWRRRFVKHVVLLAAALGGFAEGMNDLASGIDYGLPPGAGLASMRRLARSQQSTLWRLPTPLVFGDRPLVVTKNKNYSACNVAEYLRAIGFAGAVQPYVTRVLPLWQVLPAPMVPVTSIIGVGVRTPERFVYGEGGFEGALEVEFGDGDGAINLVSLLAIEEEWTGVHGQVLKVVRLPGVSHTGLSTVGFALDRVVAELFEASVTTTPMTMHEGSREFSL